MQFRNLDLNLLVALDALLSERNVTRAAERLHVSQPAMSAALQKLRGHLNDPLLQRFGNQLELTPRAASLAGPIKDFLYGVRILMREDAGFEPATADRTFKIAMTGYCAEVYGIPLASKVAELAPNVVCQVEELRADALVRVHEGQLDFCVMMPDRAVFDPTYRQDIFCETLLFTDEFVLVGDEDNALFESPVSYEAFCQQPYVEARLLDTVASVVGQALRRKVTRPKECISLPSFYMAMLMVRGSERVTIVPSRLMELHGSDWGLVSAPAPLTIVTLAEAAVWHPRNEADPAHRWFQSIMIDVAQALPAML